MPPASFCIVHAHRPLLPHEGIPFAAYGQRACPFVAMPIIAIAASAPDCRGGVFAVPREDSPAHRPKTIPASPSMPIAPYCPAKVFRSRHMAKGRARSSQCRSSQSPRPPPTVGAGSSRFLAKIPLPTAPKRFPPARPCPSPPIAPRRYSVRGIWPKGVPVRRNADHRNRRVRPRL